jgi:hypothetical protein
MKPVLIAVSLSKENAQELTAELSREFAKVEFGIVYKNKHKDWSVYAKKSLLQPFPETQIKQFAMNYYR